MQVVLRKLVKRKKNIPALFSFNLTGLPLKSFISKEPLEKIPIQLFELCGFLICKIFFMSPDDYFIEKASTIEYA